MMRVREGYVDLVANHEDYCGFRRLRSLYDSLPAPQFMSEVLWLSSDMGDRRSAVALA